MQHALRPERPRPAAHLIRAAHVLGAAGSGDVLSALKRLYPEDHATLAVLARAAIVSATTATSGWADIVAAAAVGDFIASLAPASAAARLFATSAPLDLLGAESIIYPRRNGQPSALPWVGEGSPIPIRNASVEGVVLGPAKKIAGIAVMSRRLAESANGEAIYAQLLREDAAFALDANVFSTAAASTTRPAGLLNGLTPVPASPGGDPQSRRADLQNLAAAIATSGATEVVFVASPRQAFIQQLNTDVTGTVWPSAALPDGVVIALDPAGFATASSSAPVIDVSKVAALHMEGTAPAEIVSGTGPTTAAPVRSLYQTDGLAVRLLLEAAWAVRAAGSVAYLTGADWG